MLTIVFPVAFYLLFTRVLTGGARLGNDERAFLMVSMAAYGAIGAALSAAVRVAMERTNGWTRQFRVTPLPAVGLRDDETCRPPTWPRSPRSCW